VSANAVAIQADDRIVVTLPTIPWSGYGLALARLNPDGTPDTSFGSGGIVVTPAPAFKNDRAQSLTIQPDGKIVVAGVTFGPMGQFLVERYNAADGSLDTSFGTGGRAVSTGLNLDLDHKVDVALEPDGRIVVAGTGAGFTLARFLAAGPQIGT